MKSSILLLLSLFALALASSPGMAASRRARGKTPQNDGKELRLQIWLDRQDFGPGKIDGRGGEFSTKALAFYREAHPESPELREPPPDFQEPTVTSYVIAKEDPDRVGEIPSDKKSQSHLKSLPYRSVADFVAERFHCDVDLLRRLNPGAKTNSWSAGAEIKVPNVIPFELEHYRPGQELKRDAALQKRVVRIDTKEKSLKLFEDDKLLAAFPITPGSERLPAPVGSWKIESIVMLPIFRWDPKMLNEGERSSAGINLPPGPRNPVGIVWMQLNTKGIGIHGTDDPAGIGRTSSHGCIRLANWDAAKLARMVTAGCAVEIQ